MCRRALRAYVQCAEIEGINGIIWGKIGCDAQKCVTHSVTPCVTLTRLVLCCLQRCDARDAENQTFCGQDFRKTFCDRGIKGLRGALAEACVSMNHNQQTPFALYEALSQQLCL